MMHLNDFDNLLAGCLVFGARFRLAIGLRFCRGRMYTAEFLVAFFDWILATIATVLFLATTFLAVFAVLHRFLLAIFGIARRFRFLLLLLLLRYRRLNVNNLCDCDSLDLLHINKKRAVEREAEQRQRKKKPMSKKKGTKTVKETQQKQSSFVDRSRTYLLWHYSVSGECKELADSLKKFLKKTACFYKFESNRAGKLL
jgi:hypothetical protein